MAALPEYSQLPFLPFFVQKVLTQVRSAWTGLSGISHILEHKSCSFKIEQLLSVLINMTLN